VITVADVFRRFAGTYLSAHGARIPSSHARAIADILACRTEALGGHRWRCDHCSAEIYSYHSCKNRSCPTCHRDQTERWLAARQAELLPCRYFHVTVTVPEELRVVLRTNQKDGYAALMQSAAEAIIELARDRRHVGGTVGVLAVLHTWTQQLVYHPHVHCLVTGGGVSRDGRSWHPARSNYLIPTKALANLVRGKLKAALAKRRPDLVVPSAVWNKPWVTHCTTWGDGADAVLQYLARYVFRVAVTSNRIVGLDDTGVTIRHKHRASGRWRRTRLSGHEFIRRFLQHVLPKGCTRSATMVCGTRPGANRRLAPGCCCSSRKRRHRARHHARLPRPTGLSTQHPNRNGSARLASKGTSFVSAGSTRSRRWDHDPVRSPRPSPPPPRAPAMPRPVMAAAPFVIAERAPDRRSSRPNLPLRGSNIARSSAATAREDRQPAPRRPGPRVKIPLHRPSPIPARVQSNRLCAAARAPHKALAFCATRQLLFS